jgi:hypothetical protein
MNASPWGVELFEIVKGAAELGIYKLLSYPAYYSSFPHSHSTTILLCPKSCTNLIMIRKSLVDIDMSVSFFFLENLHAMYDGV